jgi:hypothetical protein
LRDTLFNRERAAGPPRATPRAPEDAKSVAAVTERALAAARAASEKRLDPAQNKVGLDADAYRRLFDAVANEISQLRVILEGAEARERERTWVKHQVQGELDDNRLVDGATGERAVFKRRGNEDPLFGAPQKKPKRLRFVMDVSSSMARFNGADRRLDRMAATTVMVMESLQGFAHKYDYSIVGHDGESPLIPFVDWGRPPSSAAERLQVIELMYWNAMFCRSGDNTLAAAAHAIREVAREEADDYFVFVLSDANLSQYGISPTSLAQTLLADRRVNAHAIFIAREEDAEYLSRRLPPGRGHVVLNTAHLPRVFKEIFTSSLIAGAGLAKL